MSATTDPVRRPHVAPVVARPGRLAGVGDHSARLRRLTADGAMLVDVDHDDGVGSAAEWEVDLVAPRKRCASTKV